VCLQQAANPAKKASRGGGKSPGQVNKLTVGTRGRIAPCGRLTAVQGQPGPLGYRLMFISSAIMASVVVMTFALA
jgi:hypothetical protein